MLLNDSQCAQLKGYFCKMETENQPVKKKSFYDLMAALYEAENELREMSQDDLTELLGNIRDKVDSVHDWIEKEKSEAERIKGHIQDLQRKKKAIENGVERLKLYVARVMADNDTPALFGQVWQVKIQERESIKAKNIEIDSGLYLKYKDVMKRTYSFDVMALKKAYKSNPEAFKELVDVDVTTFPKFSVFKK